MRITSELGALGTLVGFVEPCECCAKTGRALEPIVGIWVVEIQLPASRAAIAAAPRRPALWCRSCADAHRRFRAGSAPGPAPRGASPRAPKPRQLALAGVLGNARAPGAA